MDIVDGTSVDGPGLRTSIYFAGCAHKCPGCHNEHTWDFMAGKDMTVDELMDHITFSGGDPLYQSEALIGLAERIKAEGYNLWCYTGFRFEDIVAAGEPENAKTLLNYIDVLVDGPFIMELKDISLRFRGSSNQRIIDVRKSLLNGAVEELILS